MRFRDRFRLLGLTVVVGIHASEIHCRTTQRPLLSCRVVGRGVEPDLMVCGEYVIAAGFTDDADGCELGSQRNDGGLAHVGRDDGSYDAAFGNTHADGAPTRCDEERPR